MQVGSFLSSQHELRSCVVARTTRGPVRAFTAFSFSKHPLLRPYTPRINHESGIKDVTRAAAASSSSFPTGPASDEYLKLRQADDVYLVSSQEYVNPTELWNADNDERCVFVWGRSMG